jgi:hypothetical protein
VSKERVVDEPGHSGDTGAADGGTPADARDRAGQNGWATPDSPWSTTTRDTDAELPAWRRPATDIRPYPRSPAPPPADLRPLGERPSADVGPSVGTRPPDNGAARWPGTRPRYADLLAGLSPAPDERPRRPDPSRPTSLRDDDERRTGEFRAIPPSSAPPYPYEGDLDDAARPRPPVAQQRAAVPLARPADRAAFPAVRPATPGGRRTEWTSGDSARHAREPQTPATGMPPVERQVDPPRPAPEPPVDRPSYDPLSFPRRLPSEAAPSHSAFSTRPPGASGYASTGDQPYRALPQRVPAEPDVPTVPEPPSVEPPAETPALARIATHLRRGDVLSGSQARQEGFDVQAILAAVREVDGVRDASLRTTPEGAHSLRLDLAEGADAAEVSRQVARLLQERMGLDAAMQGGEAPPLAPPPQFSPGSPVPSGLAAIPEPPPPPYGSRPFGSAPVPPGSAAPPPAAAFPAPRVGAPGPAHSTPAPPPGLSPPPGASPPAAPPPAAPPPGLSPPPGGFAPPRGSAPPGISAPPGAPPSGRGGSTPGPASAISAPPAAGAADPANVEEAPHPLVPGDEPAPRVIIESVQVNTYGVDATVEVRLSAGDRLAMGAASGPAVNGYVLRLCAMATVGAIDELLATSRHADGPARCYVEHAGAVPFGKTQVAVVVLLLSCGGWAEQLAGSAVTGGDERLAMVRATLAAINRRLEALLS